MKKKVCLSASPLNIRCDRCGTAISLYHPDSEIDGWRCSSCIWDEREKLIKGVQEFLSCKKLSFCSDGTMNSFNVSDIHKLKELIDSIIS